MSPKKRLKALIPGFYVDQSDGGVYLNMREFMNVHTIHDSPEGRELVWEEVRDAFGDTEVNEISDFDLLHRSEIIQEA